MPAKRKYVVRKKKATVRKYATKKRVQSKSIIPKAYFRNFARTAGNEVLPFFSPKTSSPLGNSYRTTLLYCDNITVQAGVLGVIGQYFYTANGLFDPNITAAGHQPLGFDQLAVLYSHYKVHSSKIRLTCFNEDEAFTQIVTLQLVDDTTGTPASDIMRIIEQGRLVWCLVGPNKSAASGCGGDPMGMLQFSCIPYKWLGVDIGDDTNEALVSANPIRQAYYCISVQSMKLSSDSNEVRFLVEIEYDATFFKPNEVAQS